MKSFSILFLFIFLLILVFSNVPSFAGEAEDNQCKDRCEANGSKKETGYFTDSGSCKTGFTLIEATCCCEAK